MDSSKSLTDNLDDFKKLPTKFKNLGDKTRDENEAFGQVKWVRTSWIKRIRSLVSKGSDAFGQV